MRLRARLLRILRNTAIILATLLLLAFALVQFQQHLLRHRAERLLADFHSIRLNQSTWADAQRLISRWGAWGHYDGQCTPTDCTYRITLSDQGSEINSRLYAFYERHWPQSYSGNYFSEVYSALRGRPAKVRVTFLVQDGVIKRSGVDVALDVPPQKADDPPYELLLSARASDHLRQITDKEDRILGGNEQLAEHPEYKTGRPGGCEICMDGEVTFTPYLSPTELRRLTSYNLACLTQGHPCLTLPDLLPAAKEWRLYPNVETPSDPDPTSVPRTSCNIPAFALARDSANIIAVDAISTRTEHGQPDDKYPDGRPKELASVRWVQTLLGASFLSVGTALKVKPFNGIFDDPLYIAENLEKGRRYVLFFDQRASIAPEVAGPVIGLSQCGALQDSPELRKQIDIGLARRDHLRGQEASRSLLW